MLSKIVKLKNSLMTYVGTAEGADYYVQDYLSNRQ